MLANKNFSCDKHDYDIIKNSLFFDFDFYFSHYTIGNTDPIIHYLTQGYKNGNNPSALFSTQDYYEVNQDVLHRNENPLLHFEKYGNAERRYINKAMKEESIIIEESNEFDSIFYSKKYFNGKYVADPLWHFVIYGAHNYYKPNIYFDIELFYYQNESIPHNVNPFAYYLKNRFNKNIFISAKQSREY